MATLTPTYDTGGASRPGEVNLTQPGREVTDEMLMAQIPVDGVNVPFVADFLSAALTHERCGHHLYRSVAGRSNNPMLKRKYEEFGQDTLRHVEILERLISSMGGNPNYVSPMARAVEGMDTKLVESTFIASGTADPMLEENVMLDAVFVAESVDHANWKTIRQLAGALPDGDLKTAFVGAADQVEENEDEHLGWATDMKAKMTLLQAQSSMMAKAGEKAEEMVAKVKGWFS